MSSSTSPMGESTQYKFIPLTENESKEWDFIYYGRLNHPSEEMTKIERKFWHDFTLRTGCRGLGIFPEGVMCRPIEVTQ